MGMGVSHTALANNWITTSNNDCKVYNFEDNETATWSGECKDGYVHGQGTLQWYKNGKPDDIYVGSYSQGKMHGKGILTWEDGSKYDGEFKDDKRHGKGITTWASGSKYDGEYKDDKQHGLGKLTLVKGSLSAIMYNDVEWQGDTYIVQGEFVDGEHTLQCEPNQKACDKARDKARAEQEKANIEACKSRYVGERLILKAPYGISFLTLSRDYRHLPFKVVGIGKDQMTVEAMYDGSKISDISSANISCNATSVR